MAKYETGTREWSEHSFNCVAGCAHACLYCYARGLRFNPKRGADWQREELVYPKVSKKAGVIMFPTRHDFTAQTTPHCLEYLQRLLDYGNNVLVVTKSGHDTVRRIISILDRYSRDQSEIRFTLSHIGPPIGRFWEPNAPTVINRIEGLNYAFEFGLRTSVSCEPWLDTLEALVDLVKAVSPVVTETIWIGHANKLRQRCAWCMTPHLDQTIDIVEARQTPEAAKAVYEALQGNPKVRWKAEFAAALRLAGVQA